MGSELLIARKLASQLGPPFFASSVRPRYWSKFCQKISGLVLSFACFISIF